MGKSSMLAIIILLAVMHSACASASTDTDSHITVDSNFGMAESDRFADDGQKNSLTHVYAISILIIFMLFLICGMWVATGSGNVHWKNIMLDGADTDTVYELTMKYFISQGFSVQSEMKPDQLLFKRGSYIGLRLKTIKMYLAVVISHDGGMDIRCEFYTPGTKLFRKNIDTLDDDIDSFKRFLIQHAGARDIQQEIT